MAGIEKAGAEIEGVGIGGQKQKEEAVAEVARVVQKPQAVEFAELEEVGPAGQEENIAEEEGKFAGLVKAVVQLAAEVQKQQEVHY